MMDARVVFRKTEKGEQEIVSRTCKLNHALRYVLILVDGESTVGQILGKGAGLPEIETALDYLAASGFIQTTVEANLSKRGNVVKRDAKSEIIALAHALLGPQAGPVVKKIQGSDNAPEALAQTANVCKRLIKLAINDQVAEEFVRRAQEIIYTSTLQQTAA
jgi:hypothetical protein